METSAIPADVAFDPRQIDHVVLSLMLVTSRLLAFLYTSPFFSSKTMPRTVRIGFVIALSMIVVPAPFAAFTADPTLSEAFVPLVAKELFVGIVLGSLVWMPVRGLELAGVILDTQRGSTQAQDLDVVFGGQVTPTAILLNQLFSGYFFSSGGMLLVLVLVFKSFQIWPPTEPLPPFDSSAAIIFVEFVGIAMFAAIVLILPISAMMILADIVIAFLARSAPTLNALTFGMPVKSAILLLFLVAYLDIAYPRIVETLGGALDMMEAVIGNERGEDGRTD